MTDELQKIKQLINDGQIEIAIGQLHEALKKEESSAADIYYLLGNAFRKQGNWQGALNNYQEAIAIDPAHPAGEARNTVLDILNFYNKDMFNQ